MKLALALCLSVTAACASTAQSVETRSRLPFHVALVPLSKAELRTDRSPREEGEPTDMRLPADEALAARLSESVSKALAERAFTEVTLLVAPSAGHENSDADWIAAARSQGADLLLCLELAMQPIVREEKNGKFWLSLPLFMIGGPFCWFVPDHTYYADAEIFGRFYDINRLGSDTLEASLRGSRNDIADASRSFERQDLDFLNRAQGHVGRLAVSILIPSGFLASENSDLEEEFVERVVQDLSQGFASGVLDQKNEIQSARAPYFIDLDASGVVTAKDGSRKLHVAVYLETGGDYEDMTSYRIRVGAAAAVEHEFRGRAQAATEGRYTRYIVEEPISAARGELVHLNVVAGDRKPVTRSYTFHVRD